MSGAELMELLPEVRGPIAQTGSLIAMKVLARDDDSRPQDLADLRALFSDRAPADLTMACEGLALITERGCNRGRDLLADFDVLLARFRPVE